MNSGGTRSSASKETPVPRGHAGRLGAAIVAAGARARRAGARTRACSARARTSRCPPPRRHTGQQPVGSCEQPRLNMRRQHHIDPTLGGNLLEDLQITKRVGSGRWTAMDRRDPAAESDQTQRIRIESLHVEADRSQTRRDLASGQARPLRQQHTNRTHPASLASTSQTCSPPPTRLSRVTNSNLRCAEGNGTQARQLRWPDA